MFVKEIECFLTSFMKFFNFVYKKKKKRFFSRDWKGEKLCTLFLRDRESVKSCSLFAISFEYTKFGFYLIFLLLIK
jgi:hypothetical protein